MEKEVKEKGYVYILTNPSFKEDWVKIGKSKRLPNVRGRELFNTAVPLPYEVYATLKTEKYSKAEKLIHKSIDRISDLRITSKREFFNIAPEQAFEMLADIKDLLGDEAEIELYGDNIKIEKKSDNGKRKQGEVFNFYKKGIKDNEIVNFIPDPNIKAVVSGGRQVVFEGKNWHLSPLARELFERRGEGNDSGAYQGPAFFQYKGKKLTDIKNLENNS